MSLSEADRLKVAEWVRKIRFTTGKERTDALEATFEFVKDDKNKLALCNASVGLVEALRQTLMLTDDSYATSWAVSCVGRMSASVKQNKEYLASPEMGIVPELVRLITRANCKDNVYVFFGNCILHSATVRYLLSEELGLVTAAKTEMETNSDYKFVYTFFANAVTIMPNQYAATFIRCRIPELIMNRLVRAGPDPTVWPDRNTGAVYRSMGFLTSFSTLEDGRKAIRALNQREFFTAFLRTKEKERMQASIIMANVYGRDEEDSITRSLLSKYPDLLQLLVNLLASILDYTSESKEVKDYRSMGLAFGVTKMRDATSALRCLSIPMGNKALMLKHPTFMNHVFKAIQLFIENGPECSAVYQGFQSYAGGGGKDIESLENLLELLLQLSYYYEEDAEGFHREMNKPEYQFGFRLKCLLNLGETRRLSFRAQHFALELLSRVEPGVMKDTVFSSQRALYRSTSTAIDRPQHIMLSYASGVYMPQVQALARQLRQLGFDVWTEEEGSSIVGPLVDHQDIPTIKAEAIQNSYLVIVCCSKEYKADSHCRAEAKYAQARHYTHGLRLTFVMLDADFLPDNQPEAWIGWLAAFIGSQPWFPAWDLVQVSSTTQEIAILVGNHAKLDVNLSLKPPVAPKTSNVSPKKTIMPPVPPTKQMQTISPRTITRPSSSASNGADYDLAWSVLHDPKKRTDETKIDTLLDELGVYEAEELGFIDSSQLLDLASTLKPIPMKKFKFALNLL